MLSFGVKEFSLLWNKVCIHENIKIDKSEKGNVQVQNSSESQFLLSRNNSPKTTDFAMVQFGQFPKCNYLPKCN